MAITKDKMERELLTIEKQIISTRTLLGQATLDEQPLNELRVSKGQLENRREELKAALLEYEKRQTAQKQQSVSQNTDKLRSKVNKLESQRAKAAAKVDTSLSALEAAYINHEALITEVMSDGKPLLQGARPDLYYRKSLMRSATWRSCPTLCSALGIAFTPGNKRQALAEYQTQLVAPKDA